MACKGGAVADVTVGDCVELVETMRRVHTRGGQKKVDFYLRLRALGIFPGDAPHSIRAFGLAGGRLTIEQLVDRYRIQCRPIRDLLVDYLRERQPSLDFASLDAISRTLAGLFWARVEALAPGIDSLRLPPALVRAWKDELSTVKTHHDRRGRRADRGVDPPAEREGRTDARPGALSRHRTVGRRGSRPLGGVGRALPDQRRRGPEGQGTQAPQGPDGPAHPRAAACPARAGAHRQRPAPGCRTPPGRSSRHRTGRGHRRHRRDTAKGPRPQGHRTPRLGRGHRPPASGATCPTRTRRRSGRSPPSKSFG